MFSSVRRLASKPQGSSHFYLLPYQQCTQLFCGCSRQETSPSACAASVLVAELHSQPHGESFKACIHYDISSFWHPSNLLACLHTVTKQSHPDQSLRVFWFLLPKTDLKIFPQVFFNWCRFFNLDHLWSNIKSHLRMPHGLEGSFLCLVWSPTRDRFFDICLAPSRFFSIWGLVHTVLQLENCPL